MQTPWKSEWEDEYLSLLQFAKEHPSMPYPEFDNYTLQRVNLFVVPKDEHFRSMEQALDKIIQALPALKRIFTKPITRLKDVHNILPVESVRVINNESVAHIARHSELWGDITGEGLKPRKLMTLDRQEDYAIYENVAFTKLVNMLLSFTRKNIRLLKDVMYAHRDLHFNLLERTNHLNYFLAIGKLHIGYARAQDKYNLSYERCLEKLFFIDKTLRCKLNSPVYRHCRKTTAKITLKKTNVFRLHKDYRQVYNLLKWFHEDKEEIDDSAPIMRTSKQAYTAYCNLLSVFAVGHFNFAFDQKQNLNFCRLNAESVLYSWKLRLETLEQNDLVGLRFSFSKDRTYQICLLFCNEEYSTAQVEDFKTAHTADEYLIATPIEYGAKNSVYLSLFDIDSFRRLQQLLLRGMVYSDTERERCPFCGQLMIKTERGNACPVCRTEIYEKRCPETGKDYCATGIADFKLPQRKAEETRKDKYLFDKYAEARLYYRNIQPIAQTGESLCPHCGKLHNE